MSTTILRLPAVKARTGLSRSTIYLRISDGRFPKPISLGGRAVGWIDAEIWSPASPSSWTTASMIAISGYSARCC